MTQTIPPDDSMDTASLQDKGRVLDMASFGIDRSGRILRGLRAHWHALCAGRTVPERVDVTAEGLGPALDYAFLLERISPGSARLRLAGRHLIDLMGMEVRGMPISALLNPGFRGRLSDVLESVFQAPQIAELFLMSPQAATAPAFPARMLLMPLKSDLGDVSRILGCLVSDCASGRTPRRFDLVSEKFDPAVEGASVIEPGQEPEPRSRSRLRKQLEARDFDLRNRKCAPDMGEKAARRRQRFQAVVPGKGGDAAADGGGLPAPDAGARQSPPAGHADWRPRLVIDNDR